MNALGESERSIEFEAIAGPFVHWIAPEENAEIIYGIGEAVFNCSYESHGIETILLQFEGADRIYDVTDNSTVLLDYTVEIDGNVTAILRGFADNMEIVRSSRNFTFAKLVLDVVALLDRNTTIIGDVLYGIIHDPMGDNSYSEYQESSTVAIGFSSSLRGDEALSVEVGQFISFNTETNTSVSVLNTCFLDQVSCSSGTIFLNSDA